MKWLLVILIGLNIAKGEQKMEKQQLDPNIHHYLGIELNMQVWNLLGKTERDKNDDNRMIAFAKGSLFHWYNSPNFEPVNAQRGEWMISHVYAVLNRAEKALEHANNCLELTEELGLKDFDLAYCYEAMARAHAAGGNKAESEKYFKLAEEAGNSIEDKESRDMFKGDLNSEPWYGMTKK
ncbi:MAG: tetratricopeptide repeat protein [Candidatus Delongbacteria bacterium]|nr:tetratricopeptide repeat protein [Candidatus Delongbacteria bacterium]